MTFKIDIPNPNNEWLVQFIESLPHFHRIQENGYEFRKDRASENPDFVILITNSGIKFTDYHHGEGRGFLGLLVEELTGQGDTIQIREIM